MALKSFGRGGPNDATLPSTPSPAAPASAAAAGGLTAFIDQGSEFEGKLSFRDTVRIDGRFRGEITSENTLIVGESGEIDASIRSKNIRISGTVDGNVTAGQKVILHKTARVTGDIEAPALVVEDGAVLNGQIKMTAPDSSKSGSLKALDGGAPKGKGPEPQKP